MPTMLPIEPRALSRSAVFAVFAIVSILLLGVLNVSGANATRIALVPSTVAPGGTVRVDGTGFTAASSGQLTFDGSATGMPTYAANSSGAFSVTFTVSAGAAPGNHTVSARGTVGGSKKPRNLASATLLVATSTPSPGATPTPTSSAGAVTVLAAGDVASCASSGDEATAQILGANAGTIVIPGDIAYDNGSTSDFNNCFDPSWGPYKSRMKPAPGNHEYNTAGAAGYFAYFGSVAGDPAKGYYAFNLGSWRLYSLNSNCAAIGGCGAGSAQEQWLRADLAANPLTCVAGYWHHPRFSSGSHGSSTATQALFQALYDFNADLILVGHDHDYERFAPQTATGTLDTARGIRQFVVGTGGRSHYAFPGAFLANSQAHNADTYGLLKLTLSGNGYSWQFLPEAGKTFTDTGSTACH